MKKSTLHILDTAVFAVLAAAVFGYYNYSFTHRKIPTPPTVQPRTPVDVKNITYTLEGKTFALEHGKNTTVDASGTTTVELFGEPVYGDFNNDMINDAALLLTKNSGGSSTFFYAVLALNKGDMYQPTNALLLGDRIAPQTISVENGRAVYNYAERKTSEPMTTPPSVGKSLYVQYDTKNGTIGEFVKNFEGEADPKVMTLPMKKWTWVKTHMNDGTATTPKNIDAFTLTLTQEGRIHVTTDCNTMNGSYTTKDTQLTFGALASTMMYCEGSQEQPFAAMLSEVTSYIFTKKGELVLEFKNDSGTMTFK
jgi:heat shock protein HslJ